jgi:hypothetical protein
MQAKEREENFLKYLNSQKKRLVVRKKKKKKKGNFVRDFKMRYLARKNEKKNEIELSSSMKNLI